jgi:hypothetical protein
VRRTLRDVLGSLEQQYPHLKETLLSAMGNIQTGRLLDPRFLDLDGNGTSEAPPGEDAAPEESHEDPANPFIVVG